MIAREWAELFDAKPGPHDLYGPGECPFCGARKLWLHDAIGAEGWNCQACKRQGLGWDDLEPFRRPSVCFRSVAELAQRPELLTPPEQILPRLGYRGRLVVLAAPDKAGKSTLVGHGAAAVTRGRAFLGERCRRGRVVLLGLEEAPGDAVRRFVDLDADLDRIQLVTLTKSSLLAETEKLLRAWPADLVVVDSLAEYARLTLGAAPGDGDNAGWGEVVRPLVALARDFDVAVDVLHHARRADGQYRGATEIAAAADAILEMLPDKDDVTVRRVRGRGRWTVEPFAVALRDGRYELADGSALSMDARVLLYVEENHGASQRAIRDAIDARAATVDAAINRLLLEGGIVDQGSGNRRSYFPAHQLEMGGDHAA